LIVGNHDSSWINKVDIGKYFQTVELMSVISDGAHAMTLCHYPLLAWKHAKTSYMIHGHIHANTDMDFWPLIAVRENVLNAGVDLNGFQPVLFDELFANNVRFKEEQPV
jgi:calcineurin-like phosphoesterase family protein